MRIQSSICTSHILGVQLPHVTSDYHTGQRRDRTFFSFEEVDSTSSQTVFVDNAAYSASGILFLMKSQTYIAFHIVINRHMVVIY